MAIDRDQADAVYRNHLRAFCYVAFDILNPGQPLVPNWHIEAMCFQLQKMTTRNSERRLVFNLPPRTLKSLITSVTLVAWLLGRDPTMRIICAS